MNDVKRLSLKELELWKAKARAFDEVLKFLDGRCDNEQSLHVQTILKAALK